MTASNSNQKLASLLALSAGALAMPQAADASIVYANLSTSPGKVGFSSGFGAGFNISLPNSNVLGFWKSRSSTSSHPRASTRRVNVYGSGGARIKAGGGFAVLAPANATLGKWLGGASSATIAKGVHRTFGHWTGSSSTWVHTGSANSHSPNGFSHKYLAFKFNDGAHTDYGWVDLSLGISDTSGPDLTINGYAYDNQGNEILAGDTGSAAVPEPSQTAGMAVLGALALGAVGVRRWRASNKQPRAAA